MDKVVEGIQRLKKEIIALNKELLELEEAYAQKQGVHDILCKDYDHMFNDYVVLYQKHNRIISISNEDYDRILDECRKPLGL